MPETLEVEVIAIDGAPPKSAAPSPEKKPAPAAFQGMPDWRSLGGRILKLDRRWWPLWVVLGTVLLALLVTVGLFMAAVALMFGIFRTFLRALTGGSSSSSGWTTVIRKN